MPWVKQLPSGNYRAQYRDPSGKRKSLTRATKSQAMQEARDRESDVRQGSWLDPNLGRTRFGEWHDRWWAARVVEESTRRKNRSHLDNHVLPTWRTTRLDQVTHIEVQGWVRGLQKSGVGAETVRAAHGVFSAILDAAVKEGLVRGNAAKGVRLPTVAKQPERFLTRDEFDAILSVAPEGRDHTLIHTGVLTGVRWGEAAGLHVRRVDMLRRQLSVVEVLTRNDGIKAYPKSKLSRRSLPLTDALLESLSVQLAGRKPGDLVFTGRDGDPLNYTNWRRRVWVPTVITSGVAEPLPTFHDLRHTYASWLLQDGVDIRTVQLLMGHESIVTTQRYVHASPESVDGVRRVLGARDSHLTHEGGDDLDRAAQD